MVYVDIISFKFTVSNDLRSSVNLSNIYASCFTYLRTESFIKSESYDELTVCSIETNSLKIVELEKLSLRERKKVIITLLHVTDHCNFTVNLYPITNKPYLFMNSYVLCHFSFCLFVFNHTFLNHVASSGRLWLGLGYSQGIQILNVKGNLEQYREHFETTLHQHGI